jgi:SPP1 gp7 family putative phage head morphogenesis protein
MSFIDDTLNTRATLEDMTDNAAKVMRASLDKVRKEAQRALAKIRKEMEGEEIPKTMAMKRRLEAALADIRESLAAKIDEAQTKLISAKETLYKRSYTEAVAALENATGSDVELGTSFSQSFKEAARRAARGKVLGVPTTKAMQGVKDWSDTKLRLAFTEATLRGDSIDKLSGRVDEIMGVGQRAATRIARTNMTAIMNDAQMEVYDANADIILGYRWHATFDRRTSAICASLHGRFWPLGEQPPGPPAHPNCRSILIPVLKDQELQAMIDGEETQRVKGSSGEEIVSADVDYEGWLKQQDEQFQKDVLGSETKALLFDRGALGVNDMLWPDLTTRTDEEAIQLAMVKNPDKKWVKELANELDVAKATAREIAKEEKKLEKSVPFDEGYDSVGQARRRGALKRGKK